MNAKVIDIDGNLGYVVSRVDLNTSRDTANISRKIYVKQIRHRKNTGLSKKERTCSHVKHTSLI